MNLVDTQSAEGPNEIHVVAYVMVLYLMLVSLGYRRRQAGVKLR